MEWTNEKVLSLIDLYRDRPVLWDCRLKQYKNRNKRMDALLEISGSLGVEKEEIERKIKNLVCHLSRELKKERESPKSGAGTDQVYKSKWFCYDSMLFLKDRNRPRGMTDTHIQDQKMSEDKEVIQEKTQNVDQIEEPLEHSGSTSEASEKYIKTLLKSSYAQLRSKKYNSSATQEALSIMREIKERNINTVKDQYIAFGEQVGMRIRDLSSPHAQKIVKQMISTTLFEAEMGKYDNPISFPNPYSQFFYQSFQTPQPPLQPSFSFTTEPGFIHNPPPLSQQSSCSSQIPETYQPKQEVESPTSSHPYDDSDSIDSILMDL